MSILLPGRQPPDTNEHPIYARSGWRIPCEKVTPISIRLLQIRGQELSSWRKGIEVRSVSPYPYNCVGMVFASRRAWIEPDHIYGILREDNYRRIGIDEIMEGDIVLYKNNGESTHVGIIMVIDRSFGLNVKVLSKWGKDPEFIHFMESVPDFFGVPTEYWTDRPHELEKAI